MSNTPDRSKTRSSEKTPKLSLFVVRNPGSAATRRSLRLAFSPQTPISDDCKIQCEDDVQMIRSGKKTRRSLLALEKTPLKHSSVSPATPNPSESRKRRIIGKKRSYYKKLVYDGGEFEVGDNVYVKRREDAGSDEDDPEEECRICFEIGRSLMIEGDDCLGVFHLRCLKPPLRKVPQRDWICEFCEGRKLGKKVKLLRPSEGKKLRTA